MDLQISQQGLGFKKLNLYFWIFSARALRTFFILGSVTSKGGRCAPTSAHRSFAASFFNILSVYYEERASVLPLVKRPNKICYPRDLNSGRPTTGSPRPTGKIHHETLWRENRSWRKNPGKIVTQQRHDDTTMYPRPIY